MLTKTDVIAASALNIAVLLSRYQDAAGKEFVGVPVSEVGKMLRGAGWKNVSNIDSYDLINMDLEIRAGSYKGFRRPSKRLIDVLVIREV